MDIKRSTVVYLQHGISYGGATSSLYLLLKSLDRARYEPHLFTTGVYSEEIGDRMRALCSSIRLVGIPQIHNNQVSHTALYRYYAKRLAPVGPLVRALNAVGVDILHVNTTVFPHVYEPVKKHTRAKIVTHVREMIPRIGRGTVRDYMIEQIRRYSDAIIAITDNEAEPFRGHPGLRVFPNPFDFTESEKVKGGFRSAHGISDDCVLVGMVAQFHPHKGHKEFLEALERLRRGGEARPPYRFVIVGVSPPSPLWKRAARSALGLGNYREEVLGRIERNGLGPHLLMVPYTFHVMEILKELDIVVRPSISGDPWGRDIIEAMAAGKPVVATGTSEFYVVDGRTGYLVPPQDPGRMADTILGLMNDPELRRRFGESGYERIRAMCDLDEYGRKLAAVYASIH